MKIIRKRKHTYSIYGRKNPHISDPTQLKPMVVKGQL